MNVIEKHELRTGKKVSIAYDEDAESPREWDTFTKMICFHKRYNLGDKHDYKHNDYESWEELGAAITDREKPILIKPLYLYDHSGITISTKPFGCNWDSGQVGFVVVTQQTLDDYGFTIAENESWNRYYERIESRVEEDIKIYDSFITGEVYRFLIEDKDGDVLDSCGGFYGDYQDSGLIEYIKDSLSPEEFEELDL
jgi:hypothetical protein